MEPSEDSDLKMDPKESEAKSRSSTTSNPPRKSPPYGSILPALPQSMPPTEGFSSLPSNPYDSGSSRGHSPYEYGQPIYSAHDRMFPGIDLPEPRTRRSSGILPGSSEGFSSSLGSGGAFSALPPLDQPSSYYSPSPVYGYGSSTPGYSSTVYQDPYSSSTMGSGSSYQHTYASGESGYGMYPSMAGMPAYPYSQAYPEYQSGRGYGPPGGRFGGQRRPRHTTSYASVPGPPIVQPGGAKGPDGANLFVFHIPNDFSNQEMYDMFAQYGNVLSARIMVEAETGRSRGFGFVSFDSTAAAANAIKHLNGYPIKGKRLKVQHKQIRGKDNPYEPYSYYPAQSSAPTVPIQQFAGSRDTSSGQGYNLPTHLLGDEGETDDDKKPAATEETQEVKRGPRHHTPVLPPMPPQPPDDDDEEDYSGSLDAPDRQDPSPLGDLQDLSKALPNP
ncbi:hypothetical protein ACHAXN_006178 [Cyclotella atomus]